MGREGGGISRRALLSASVCCSPFLALAGAGWGGKGRFPPKDAPRRPPPHTLGSGLRSPSEKVSQWAARAPGFCEDQQLGWSQSTCVSVPSTLAWQPRPPQEEPCGPRLRLHPPTLHMSISKLLWKKAWCGGEATPLSSGGRSPVGCGLWPAAYPAGMKGSLD